MAKCEVRLPDDFAERLSKLGSKTDEIIGKVLQAGGEVVLGKVRSNLDAVLSGDSTGELSRSLGISKARVNKKGGQDVKIGFAENRRDGKSNAMLVNILEYGKHGQPPKPFLKPAKRQAETQEVRISLYSKGNYRSQVRRITNAVLAADITVTERRYTGFDETAKYHGYSIDVTKFYSMEGN